MNGANHKITGSQHVVGQILVWNQTLGAQKLDPVVMRLVQKLHVMVLMNVVNHTAV